VKRIDGAHGPQQEAKRQERRIWQMLDAVFHRLQREMEMERPSRKANSAISDHFVRHCSSSCIA
jgi:hypothetical protein